MRSLQIILIISISLPVFGQRNKDIVDIVKEIDSYLIPGKIPAEGVILEFHRFDTSIGLKRLNKKNQILFEAYREAAFLKYQDLTDSAEYGEKLSIDTLFEKSVSTLNKYIEIIEEFEPLYDEDSASTVTRTDKMANLIDTIYFEIQKRDSVFASYQKEISEIIIHLQKLVNAHRRAERNRETHMRKREIQRNRDRYNRIYTKISIKFKKYFD